MRKKAGSDVINITNYKNNSEAEMEILSADMANELQGVVVTGENETLARMRGFKRSYFNGKIIEVTLMEVGFSEFLQIVKDWQFGIDSNIENSRGYITVPTPDGIFEIFPFGSKGFAHDKKRNEMTLRGKVRGTNAPNPILLSAIQNNVNTVTLEWDYSDVYINPTIQIRASLDGLNYTTIETVNNVKNHTFSSDFFDDILTGTEVCFQIVVTTNDFFNKNSNVVCVDWMFNDFTLKEISSTQDSCYKLTKTYILTGNGSFDFEVFLLQNISGGEVNLLNNNISFMNFNPVADGNVFSETKTYNNNVVTSFAFNVVIDPTNFDGTNYLNCSNGNNDVYIQNDLLIEVTEVSTSKIKNIVISHPATKKYFS